MGLSLKGLMGNSAGCMSRNQGLLPLLSLKVFYPILMTIKRIIFNMWICCFIFVKENPISGGTSFHQLVISGKHQLLLQHKLPNI